WGLTDRLQHGRLRPVALKPEQMEECWADLACDDALKAHRATWILTAGAPDSIKWLAQRFRPVPKVAPERVAQLVAKLDHDSFLEREGADREWSMLGESVREFLVEASKKQQSDETKRRLTKLLETVDGPLPSRAVLRCLRATAVLQQIGNADAIR